jgi:hypothetical protein
MCFCQIEFIVLETVKRHSEPPLQTLRYTWGCVANGRVHLPCVVGGATILTWRQPCEDDPYRTDLGALRRSSACVAYGRPHLSEDTV